MGKRKLVKRILIFGLPGSGKSTLSEKLEEVLHTDRHMKNSGQVNEEVDETYLKAMDKRDMAYIQKNI